MKKTLTYVITALGLFSSSASFAQEPKANIDEAKKIGQAEKSAVFEEPLAGKVNTPSGDLDWLPTLVSKKRGIEHSLPEKEEVEARKAEKKLLKESSVPHTLVGESDEEEGDGFVGAAPLVGEDFAGNPNNGSSPMDNSIAISDDGIIVSVANTTIEYNTMSGTTTYSNSIVDFLGDPSISYVCDPVVLYDPEADRFIFFAQECSGNSSNSYLLILFSQTNDPADGWNYYKLTGNPLGDASWFDYPKLAISDSELFISGNLFYDSYSYNQPVVYQMEKNDGYAGAPLTWQYWSGIPGSPGTILPVSSGSEANYGPGIYMVSTRPYSGNTVKFYEITNDIASGSEELNYYSVSTSFYDVAADANQRGTSCDLDIGDCRCLSGFYLDGIVHFVFQSDVGSGWNGINYNRLNVSSLSNTSVKYGDSGNMDYSYPSIAWFGTDPDDDKSVMINFGSVSSGEYPQVRVVHCDDDMEWSETTVVKESISYACFTSPSVERWGDYTGIARKFNSPEPSVWLNGMYGTASHVWNTWIAEIHADAPVDHTGLEDNVLAPDPVNIAPNPIVETFILNFETTEDIPVEIQIIGMDGKLVKELYSGTAFAGDNKFAFNKANLASGTYFLQILSPEKQIANEKIIVQ